MLTILLGASTVPVSDEISRVRAFTRSMEFNYVSWTFDALGVKFGQLAMGNTSYLPAEDKSSLVLSVLDLIKKVNELEGQVNEIYSDPQIDDPKTASIDLLKQIRDLQTQRDRLNPIAESILEDQVSEVAAQMGLSFAGQALPPVLFHITPPPDSLIISPRHVIRQDMSISISPDTTVDQMDALENQVDKSLNVSSLVVGIGGIGLYPTMVEETTNINNLTEVVAHEWIHNYLTWHPLGFSYENSPELRTMNETVASIAGKELGRAVVQKYYPEFLPPEAEITPNEVNEDPSAFNFDTEMHLTRVTTDQLLAEGKVDDAEAYMESRRQFFWGHGYHIRKLNQAYFAFYGAYADQPASAAGDDPVGAAVRLLRANSSSLADFINRVAWMWNFDQLKEAVGSRK